MTPSGRNSLTKLFEDPWIILAIALTLLLLFLIVYPQGWIIRTSLFERSISRYTAANYLRFFIESRFRTALRNSILVSVLSLGGALVIALPLAFLLSRYTIPFKSALLSLITMSVMSPPFLGAYAWVILLGRLGILSRALREVGIPFGSIVGMRGIVWTCAWITYPLVFLLSYDAFSAVDPSLEEAAMSVGATRRRTIFNVTLPMAMPGVLTGAYMAVMATFADFGTPMIIGGGYSVLPVLVYGEFLSEIGGELSMASTSSMIMLAVSTSVLLLQRYYVMRRTYASVSTRRQKEQRLSSAKSIFLLVYVLIIVLVSFVPHITVLITSFMKWEWGILKPVFTLANYIRVFKQSSSPIFVSFFITGVATLLQITIGLVIAYIIVRKSYPVISSMLNILVMIPYIIPGTVLGIGLIMVFNKPPLVITGTWMILCLSYFIRKLPFFVKAAEAALYQVHPSLEEAAMSVGASSVRTFWNITAPLILPGIISGATMSFLMNITEVSSTIILYAAPTITMTMVIFTNAITAGSDFGVASGMTVILMLSIYIPLYLVNKLGRKTSTSL